MLIEINKNISQIEQKYIDFLSKKNKKPRYNLSASSLDRALKRCGFSWRQKYIVKKKDKHGNSVRFLHSEGLTILFETLERSRKKRTPFNAHRWTQ